jgi:hypothetical protein
MTGVEADDRNPWTPPPSSWRDSCFRGMILQLDEA